MIARNNGNLTLSAHQGIRRLVMRAIAIVAFAVAGTASAKVAPTTIAKLFEVSDRVVLGRVVKIERLGGFKWAHVDVTHNIKGAGADEILFLAEPTWTCDTSSASIDVEALLFLVDAAKPETSWHFKSPNKKKLPANAFLVAWSGRGQMPLRTIEGERFATAWHDIAIPADVRRIPGPEPEYSFIESFRLADLLKLFERLSRARGA